MIHSPFVFSSRRRHTRLQGDWSSDVCSSDLVDDCDTLSAHGAQADAGSGKPAGGVVWSEQGRGEVEEGQTILLALFQRSEERRVGKECGLRGSEEHGQGQERRTMQ